MKEQIKNLVIQAGLNIDGYGDPIWGCLDTADAKTQFLEKFTTLIVTECADEIQRAVSMKYKDGGETEEFMGGHYAGSVLARVKIKSYFGIKE